MIRLLIVDDHHLFREGLRRVLGDAPGLAVAGCLSSGEEAVARTAELRPDLVLMDVNMPGMGGVEACRQLRLAHPQLQVLMLTVSEQETDLFTAIRAGAHGYLLKNATSAELIDAIQRVHAGEAIIAPGMAVKLLNEFAALAGGGALAAEPTEDLSAREREILQRVAAGLSNKQIGAELALSPHTIKAHLRTILDKLHLRSRAEAAAWAARQRLV
jgi:two-component system NarL family response regulator